MEFFEANPLPKCCQDCLAPDEGYCDKCDHLGERFILSEEDRKLMEALIKQRINRQREKGNDH